VEDYPDLKKVTDLNGAEDDAAAASNLNGTLNHH
jgi:hypothetical protein